MKKLLFTVLLAFLGLATPGQAKTPGEVGVGEMLRDMPMQGLAGPSRLLSAYRGKPLIINVWASWCGPCRAEMGSLERLSRRNGGKQFAVIGISTDDYPDAAKAFLQKSATRFSHFIDSQLALENMLGADRIPLTLLIDANGRVLAKHYGARDWDSAEAVALVGKAFGIRM